MSKVIYHVCDPKRELVLVKCPCRQMIWLRDVPADCLCGRRHVRREELPGKVRQKIIGGGSNA